MQNHPLRGSAPGKFIVGLIAVIVVIAAGYFGYLWIMQWHQKAVREAVEKKEAEIGAGVTGTGPSVRRYDRRPDIQDRDRQQPEEGASENIRRVFGESSGGDGIRTMEAMEVPSCFRLEKQINAFFDYLDRQGFLDAALVEAESSRQVFDQMISAISKNPPLVVGETRDMVSLMHNQAHFFRILDKERIQLVRYIFNSDADVLEHAMSNFYDYYVEKGGCGEKDYPAISLGTLYEYASFFLNTFSGKSYMMRRSSAIRCLVRYYSVRVLDKANRARLNRYGIDIRPHIELALDSVRHQNSLIYQDIYLERLARLQAKYR